MLSGIISDTLKFTSPTTTEYDKYVANRLADIAGVDIDEYSKKMFKAGTSLKGKTIEQVIDSDIKVYNEDVELTKLDVKILFKISHIFTYGN